MWHIDRDYINDGPDSRVGREEQHSRVPVFAAAAGIQSERLSDSDERGVGLTQARFRLLDDDGEVYYCGWLHDDPDCENQLAALNFGMADAGTTTIQIRRGDKWEVEIA